MDATVIARETMKRFSRCAYQSQKKMEFQTASQTLYGPEFTVTVSIQGRMQFNCLVCNKEMNSEYAMGEHARSGTHQKNADKCKLKAEVDVSSQFPTGLLQHKLLSRNADKCKLKAEVDVSSQFPTGSLQHKLLSSQAKAIGLQYVCEFHKGKNTNPYYKCDLCAAHGRIDAMYLHLIGLKHTKKYISIRVHHPSLTNSLVVEECRQFILEQEGSRITEIAVIKDPDMFPHKWASQVHDSGAGPSSANLEPLPPAIAAAKWDSSEEDVKPPVTPPVTPSVSTLDKATDVMQRLTLDHTGLMMKINYIVQMLEDESNHLQVNDCKDGEGVLQCFLGIGKILYETANYKLHNSTVDATQRNKLDGQVEMLNKVLGRVQKILLPAFSEAVNII